MARAIARLRFQKVNSAITGEDDKGEAVLYANRTVVLHAGTGLKRRVVKKSAEADKATLIYGATGFMAISALGAALVLKRKAVAGYLTLALAGITALQGSRLRSIAKGTPGILDRPLATSDFTATLQDNGALLFVIALSGNSRTTLIVQPGEYEPAEAEKFIKALRK